jgi:hypothetical protein
MGRRCAAAWVKPNFLQKAMLNHARLGPLGRARAVLNADIDELIQPMGHTVVFDAACAAWHGTVNIGGEFVFPHPPGTMPVPQKAHVARAVPPAVSTRKWCATPRGVLSRMGWFVHQVGGEPFKLVPESGAFRLVHCRAANPNWATGHAAASPATVRVDPALREMMDTYLHDE